jgi:hypothetical protein
MKEISHNKVGQNRTDLELMLDREKENRRQLMKQMWLSDEIIGKEETGVKKAIISVFLSL